MVGLESRINVMFNTELICVVAVVAFTCRQTARRKVQSRTIQYYNQISKIAANVALQLFLIRVRDQYHNSVLI